MRVRHLLDHVRDGVVTCQPERRLQQTEDPGDTVVPSRLVDVGSEDKVAGLEVGRSGCKTDDDDDNSAGERPAREFG